MLHHFNNNPDLQDAAFQFFTQELGFSVKNFTRKSFTAKEIFGDSYKDTSAFQKVTEAVVVGMVDEKSLKRPGQNQPDMFESDGVTELKNKPQDYPALFLYAIRLNELSLAKRSTLAELTRALNREYKGAPVIVLFLYGKQMALATCRRSNYKVKHLQGEKIGKVTLMLDINLEKPHPGHVQLLENLKPDKKSQECFSSFLAHILEILNVELLNKKFYKELFNWYLWAQKHVVFPQVRPSTDTLLKDDQHRSESLIRLLTRMLFVWFMKEKGLINNDLFKADALRNILKNFNPADKEASDYYPAILQNLFFATLNQEVKERSSIGGGLGNPNQGKQYFYRFRDCFRKPQNYATYFENIPFLNGGLFDCLDIRKPANASKDFEETYLDGFTSQKKYQPHLPDFLFFGEFKEVDLSGENEYNDPKKKKETVHGLIDIFEKFKFTIEENTPLEEDVALDPELLGKVFENLLASYNTETSGQARKQTGSFYTPREIVDYMVDESLIAYLNTKLEGEENEKRIKQLFSRNESGNPFNEAETLSLLHTINNCKILDPACGSGAFPMGVLQKLLFVLQKLDPENKVWFELVIQGVPAPMRELARKKLENENWNYVRKIGLIQECIYGIDIQPIATQIAKLRFFISLLVDQQEKPEAENRGFEPLPNLDFKLVTANTLISAPKTETDGFGLFAEVEQPFFASLNQLTSEYFNLHKPDEKEKKREEIRKLIHEECAIKEEQINKRVNQKAGTAKEQAALEKQLAQKEQEIKLWRSYENLFKQESVGFFETRYFFPNVKEGFDVVIGNPPYVRVQSLDEASKNYYAKNYVTATKNFDIYVLFNELGLKILKPGGSLIFIQPNKFFNSDYGIGLRELVAENRWIKTIVDFEAEQIFNSATTYTCISHFQKAAQSSFQFVTMMGRNKDEKHQSFMDYSTRGNSPDQVQEVQFDYSKHNKEGWSFGSTFDQEIFQKLEIQGKTLAAISNTIFVGLQTSADPVYILEKHEEGYYSKYLDEVIPLESKLLKPLLKGAEIRRYWVDYQNLYLIFPYKITTNGAKLYTEDELAEVVPKTWSYLNRCQAKLKGRENGKMDHEEWYAYVYPKNLDQFVQPKIMTQVLANKASMVLDEDEGYHFVGGGNAGGYGVVLNPDIKIGYPYLLGLLNSTLLDFYLQNHSSRFQNGYFSYAKRFIENLPIKTDPDEQSEDQVTTLVTEILDLKKANPKADTTKQEREIDVLVYKLYGLTYKEVKVVDPWFWLGEEEYHKLPFN